MSAATRTYRHPGVVGMNDDPDFDDFDAWSMDEGLTVPTIPTHVEVEPEFQGHGTGTRTGRKHVDGATHKQVAFIKRLAAERGIDFDTDDLTKRAATRAIDTLLATPKTSTTTTAPAAAPAGRPNRYDGRCTRCGTNVPAETGTCSKVDGRWVVQHTTCPEVPAATPEAPEGFHFLDGDIFKVQIAHHGSGRLYAKRLVLPSAEAIAEAQRTGDKVKGSWEIARGFVTKLSAATLLTQEQAIQYGHLYGVCGRCGTVLTDENSIERGIGPVCATKF